MMTLDEFVEVVRAADQQIVDNAALALRQRLKAACGVK